MIKIEVEKYITVRLNYHEACLIRNALIEAGNKGISTETNEEWHNIAKTLDEMIQRDTN